MSLGATRIMQMLPCSSSTYIHKLKPLAFSGKVDDWFLWKAKFRAMLMTYGLSRMLEPYSTKTSASSESASCVGSSISVKVEQGDTKKQEASKKNAEAEQAFLEDVANVDGKYRVAVSAVYGTLLTSLPDALSGEILPSLYDCEFAVGSAKVVLGCPHPHDLWSKLCEQFERNTPLHQRAIESELDSLKMKTSFTAYKSKLDLLAARLAAMGEPVSDNKKLRVLLAGLPRSAKEMVTLLDYDKAQTYTTACDKLWVHFSREEQREAEDSGQTEILMVTKGKRSSSNKRHEGFRGARDEDSKCFHCQKKGHKQADCWLKHPEKKPANKDKGRSNGKSSFKQNMDKSQGFRKCGFCGRNNHSDSDCKFKREYEQKAHSNSGGGGEVNMVLSTQATSKPGSDLFFGMMDRSRPEAVNEDAWIVDTGAAYHVCNNIEAFETVQDTEEPKQARPYTKDGQAIRIEKEGTVRLRTASNGKEKALVLTKVAFIPQARCNLISAGRLQVAGYTYRTVSDSNVKDWECIDSKSGQTVLEARLVGPSSLLKAVVAVKWSDHAHTHTRSCNTDGVMDMVAGIHDVSCASLHTWHQRMGHLRYDALTRLANSKNVCGMKFSNNEPVVCDVCKISKARHKPFGVASNRSTVVLERVHADVCGPVHTATRNGSKYYLVIVDDASRHTSVYFLKQKSDALKGFNHYRLFWQAHLGKQIKFFRSDNGGEFTSNEFEHECADNGIHHEKTIPETPQQDGVSERKIQALNERARCMMLQASIPSELWSEAVREAAALLNASPTVALKTGTPNSVWYGKPTNVEAFRVFGCEAYIKTKQSDKFGPRAERGVYLGMDEERKAYRILNLESEEIAPSRDVAFNENIFPFADVKRAIQEGKSNIETWSWVSEAMLPERISIPAVPPGQTVSGTQSGRQASVVMQQNDQSMSDVGVVQEHSRSTASANKAKSKEENPEQKACDHEYDDDDDDEMGAIIENKHDAERKDERSEANERASASVPIASESKEQKNAQAADIDVSNMRSAIPNTSAASAQVEAPKQSSSGTPLTKPNVKIRSSEPVPIPKPTSHVQTRSALAQQQPLQRELRSRRGVPSSQKYGDSLMSAMFVDVMTMSVDPVTIDEAWSRPDGSKWKEATDREHQALLTNETWDLVVPPTDQKVISCKWVLRIKYNSDGTVNKYKARLVARGFQQKQGIDYEETFAPVGTFTSLRLLLAIAVKKDLKLYQFDVESAFLNGDLQHNIYMYQPSGYDDESGRVCKLKKALYGLKQASRSWNTSIHTTLLDMGFKHSQVDPCLYVHVSHDGGSYLFLYVDDMVLATNSESIKDMFYKSVSDAYKVKDMGELKWMLNMEVSRDSTGVVISQRSFIDKLLSQHNMDEARPVSTPMSTTPMQSTAEEQQSQSQHNEDVSELPYQSVVGSLLWLSNMTRPDISYATNKLCRKMSNYTYNEWKAAKRVLRYLSGTRDHGIMFKQSIRTTTHDDDMCVVGYSDSNWGADGDDRRSTSGYVFTVSGGPVSWTSRVQKTVALSSVEAEYMALSTATQEALHIKQLLESVEINVNGVVLYCDNQGAIKLAANAQYHPRTKHIDIRYHFIRQYVDSGVILLKWVDTKAMLADQFTKPLQGEIFSRLSGTLMVGAGRMHKEITNEDDVIDCTRGDGIIQSANRNTRWL